MSDRQLERVRDEAIGAARLGRAFPAYQALEAFEARVRGRLAAIREQARREPTALEEKKIRAMEARRQHAPVAGFDLVFSPVKSAALLWALDHREHVREAVRAAHESAVREALDLVEEHAALTRTGRGGIAQIQTGGLIAAAFEHWDSRAGDPNLHTHVAVSSKVRGADGKWRALDARVLYAMKVTASETYNTAFEARLSASLGVSFTARPDTTGGREPVREITGVPFGMIEFFSRRRAAIEARYAELLSEFRDSHGHDPAPSVGYQLAQRANLDTRQGKKPPRSLSGKREAWREELHEASADAGVISFPPGRSGLMPRRERPRRSGGCPPDRGPSPAAPRRAPSPARKPQPGDLLACGAGVAQLADAARSQVRQQEPYSWPRSGARRRTGRADGVPIDDEPAEPPDGIVTLPFGRIRGRTNDGLAQAAAEGRHGGRRPVISKDMMRIALGRRADGESVTSIAKRLTYKTASGEERTVSRRALYNAFKAHDAECAEPA